MTPSQQPIADFNLGYENASVFIHGTPEAYLGVGTRRPRTFEALRAWSALVGSVQLAFQQQGTVSLAIESVPPVRRSGSALAASDADLEQYEAMMITEFFRYVAMPMRPVTVRFRSTRADQRAIKLERLYRLHDATQVRGFLRSHPHLVDVILEAYPHVQKHFGSNPEVVLEVVTDPEAEGSELLFAYILTSLPTKEALDRLDRLDEDWFLDQFDRVGDLFGFNL